MEDFTNYVNTVNSAIHAYDYEIRFTYPQNATTRSPDTAVYALVNTTSDPLTQMATTHAPDEIAFVKRVLDAIFETHNTKTREVMAVKDMEAARLNKAPRNRESFMANEETQGQPTQGSSSAGITQAAAEQVLKKLTEEGWLEKSRNGYLSLKPRALMELRSWLVEMYNEPDEEDEDEGPQWQKIKFCEACREIVTTVRCSPELERCSFELIHWRRVKDARMWNAFAASTTSAQQGFFARSQIENARSVKRIGPPTVLLAREQPEALESQPEPQMPAFQMERVAVKVALQSKTMMNPLIELIDARQRISGCF
jgi:hypothetical protein